MAWVVLFLAGILEAGWAVGLKYTNGFTRLWPTLGTGLAIVVSLWLLSLATRTLPIGTAYAVWAGLGVVGTVTLGVLLFDEPANPLRLIGLALIVAGIVCLRLTTV